MANFQRFVHFSGGAFFIFGFFSLFLVDMSPRGHYTHIKTVLAMFQRHQFLLPSPTLELFQSYLFRVISALLLL